MYQTESIEKFLEGRKINLVELAAIQRRMGEVADKNGLFSGRELEYVLDTELARAYMEEWEKGSAVVLPIPPHNKWDVDVWD